MQNNNWFGSPNKSGKASSHGSPLGDEELRLVRKNLNWNYASFEIPKNLKNEWISIGQKASKKAEKHKKIYNKKISKLGWLGWSLANKFKKDFPKI